MEWAEAVLGDCELALLLHTQPQCNSFSANAIHVLGAGEEILAMENRICQTCSTLTGK